jgi:hypothetical protein
MPHESTFGRWNRGTPSSAMSAAKTRFGIAFLWFVVVAALLFRIYALTNVKEGLTHDESWAWLCASAAQSRFDDELPELVNHPVPAASFHAFLQRPASFEFRTVARDLALKDIHPPLFFWGLHAQHVLVGLTPQNQSAINLTLALVTLGLVYRLGRRLSGSHAVGMVCAAVWFLSPAVIGIEFQTRHYPLFAVLALLSIDLGDRIIAGDRSLGTVAMFCLVCAAGMLTHYYFVITMVPGTLMVLATHRLGVQSRLYIGAAVVALALFLICFPEFFDFLSMTSIVRGGDAIPANKTSFLARLIMLGRGASEYFSLWRSLLPVYVIALLALIAAACVRLVRGLSPESGDSVRLALNEPTIRYAVILSWFVVFSATLYLAEISPTHAFRGQYFAYIWPLASVFLVMIVRSVVPLRLAVLGLVLHLIQSIASWPYVVETFELKPAVPAAWTNACDWSGTVVTNDLRMGFLLRNLIDLRADLPVVAVKDISAIATVTADEVMALELENEGNVSAEDLRAAMEENRFRQRGPQLDAANERTSQWNPMTLSPWRRDSR